MTLSKFKPTTPGRRHGSVLKTVTPGAKPIKALLKAKRKISGRNHSGRITVRHRGGGVKRRLRLIDFKRQNHQVEGVVDSIQYDPNRNANIALIIFKNGDKRYILAPQGLQVGHVISAGPSADLKPGNALPLSQIPIGTPIHNLEINPGKGGQIVRGAGTFASIQSKEGKYAAVVLPSKEIRLFSLDCYATIGQVGNEEYNTLSRGKAGRMRHLGRRPEVRGTAMNPKDHPHGGGEGRSGIGMKAPKTPWGKRTLGVKTRRRRYSDRLIIKRRNQKSYGKK